LVVRQDVDASALEVIRLLSLQRGGHVLAAIGGFSLVGILVVILLVVAIMYFVRRS
jgi:hypothetical protein